MPTVKLSTLRANGARLKAQMPKADLDHDGRLTADEVKRYARTLPDGFQTGKALLTFTSWAIRDLERAGSASVRHVQSMVDTALAIIEKKAGGDGVIDDGKEYNSVKRLKTFQALGGTAQASPVRDGEDLMDLMDRSTTQSERRLSSPAGVSASLAKMVIAASNQSTYKAKTLAEVFAQVDDGEVDVTRIKESSTGRNLIVIDYGAGDNTYGAVFDASTRKMVAAIQDSEIVVK